MTEATTPPVATQDASAAGAHVAIADVHFEHLGDTLGLGTARPRLSWVVDTKRPGWWQEGYAIEAVAADGSVCGQTGWVASDQSVLVPWPFAPLQSRERLALRVR